MNFADDFIIFGSYAPRTDRHLLSGTVKENGAPAKKRILVFSRESNTVIASTFSDATTGHWQISHTLEYPEKSLFAVAFDDTETFNAEIADFISQVTMP